MRNRQACYHPRGPCLPPSSPSPTLPPSPPPSLASSPLPAIHPYFVLVPTGDLWADSSPPGPTHPDMLQTLPRSPPACGSLRACPLRRTPGVPSLRSQSSLHHFLGAPLSALNSSFALDLPSGPTLTSRHQGSLAPLPCTPPAQSYPLPTSSTLLGHPPSRPRGWVGTWPPRSWGNLAPVGHRDQRLGGTCRTAGQNSYRPLKHLSPGSLFSEPMHRPPHLEEAPVSCAWTEIRKGLMGQKWRLPCLSSSVHSTGPERPSWGNQKSAACPPRKEPQQLRFGLGGPDASR
ncbi:uncharacterized protein LOC132539253 [Erinaceus europaeus]|uniref:Uncharacterized protein LOC132539253 n=1 Tax=Erinaceus europaeus TaxID=9365 RepID=A0ABM3XKQ5_ERIEU|nr:uncharacterized protein LOC132539253 [Erinaceus europaeus]